MTKAQQPGYVGFTSDLRLHIRVRDNMAKLNVLCPDLQYYGWATVKFQVIVVIVLGFTDRDQALGQS